MWLEILFFLYDDIFYFIIFFTDLRDDTDRGQGATRSVRTPGLQYTNSSILKTYPCEILYIIL